MKSMKTIILLFSVLDALDSAMFAPCGILIQLVASSDVAQNVAHELILDYFGPIHIGGPFKANWAKGEA